MLMQLPAVERDRGQATAWRFRVERRPELSWLASLVVTAVAVGLALAASSVLLIFANVNVFDAFEALFFGALGDLEGVSGSLTKAIPQVFTGLSAGIAFRAKIWNVGQEGQVYAGSMMAYWLSSSFEL